MSEDQNKSLPYYYYIDASTSIARLEQWGKIEEEQHIRVTRREDVKEENSRTYALNVVPYESFARISNDAQFKGLFDDEHVSTADAFDEQYKIAKDYTDKQYEESQER